MLEITGIHKSFGGLAVLTDVGLAVARGSLVGLIGPNGAGKTTLFNLLTGFLRPDSGAIRFNGSEITTLAPEQRSRLGISRTFQLVKPFSGLTVLENVLVGAYAATRNSARARMMAHEALVRVGIGDRGGAFPGGLTLPDRKRMELARCLATRPQLLLLDEVMCGLNPSDMASMFQVIRSLRDEGITIVVVEHIMDAISELADQVVALSAGRILAQGTPAEVFGNPAVIQAYLGTDF